MTVEVGSGDVGLEDVCEVVVPSGPLTDTLGISSVVAAGAGGAAVVLEEEGGRAPPEPFLAPGGT